MYFENFCQFYRKTRVSGVSSKETPTQMFSFRFSNLCRVTFFAGHLGQVPLVVLLADVYFSFTSSVAIRLLQYVTVDVRNYDVCRDCVNGKRQFVGSSYFKKGLFWKFGKLSKKMFVIEPSFS